MRARYKVVLERRLEDERDEWGNQTDTKFSDPEDLDVFGWAAPSGSEPVTAGDNRVVVEVQLLAPADTGVASGDVITLPRNPAGRHRVLADPQEYNASPFSSWQPGVVINLRKVTG